MGTISDSGCQNPHQERCFLSRNPRMLKDYDFEECRAWVHRLCQDDWLEQHEYKAAANGLLFCREHNQCDQKWVQFRAGRLKCLENGSRTQSPFAWR